MSLFDNGAEVVGPSEKMNVLNVKLEVIVGVDLEIWRELIKFFLVDFDAGLGNVGCLNVLQLENETLVVSNIALNV